jgi:hypothetical protein
MRAIQKNKHKQNKYILHMPNEETIQVIRDIEAGRGIFIVSSFDEVLKLANISTTFLNKNRREKSIA